MPLRLKSLELHGYKTFAAKTIFEFSPTITAIVGPNGSGKSNIADALRWVLGEQSYSLLRAKKTEDMIFSGSERRTRAGMAAATVIFDNSTNWLPIEFSEVALSRRAYRDGRNEYLLNGQHVRLKDINELLAQSGLSERTYTIIGQGLVDASLALRADERRRLFEEAAGIGLYRARREEALHRLEATQRNLERILDILAEIEPRLRSLERQAARAQEFAQIQADLRQLLREWYGFHWHRAQAELTKAVEFSRSQEAKLAEARQSYQQVRQKFASFHDQLNGLRSRLNSWHRLSAQLHESREAASSELAMLEERQRSLLDNRQEAEQEHSRLNEELRIAQERLLESEAEAARLQMEYDEAQRQVEAAQAALQAHQLEKKRIEADLEADRRQLEALTTQGAQLQARLNELTARLDLQKQKLASAEEAIAATQQEVEEAVQQSQTARTEREAAKAELNRAEANLQSARKRLSSLEEKNKQKQAEQDARQAEKARLLTQLEILKQAEQSLAGYAEGTRLLLEAARQFRLKEARGTLSSVLEVPEQLEAAIAAALGEFTDAVLLKSDKEIEQALTLLENDPSSSRASLLPLDRLSPPQPLEVKPDADCLGVAADLVKAPAELRPAVDLLLGQVLVVRNPAAAKRLLAGQSKMARAVTLQGEVFHATGQVLAGRPKAEALGRSRQQRELQEALKRSESLIDSLQSDIEKLTGQLEAAQKYAAECEQQTAERRALLETALANEHQAQVREEAARHQREWQVQQKKEIEAERLQTEQEIASVSQALSENEKRVREVQEAIREKTNRLAGLTMGELQEQAALWTTRAAIAERSLGEIRRRAAEHQETRARLEKQVLNLEKRLSDMKDTLADLTAKQEQLRSQTENVNVQLEELRQLIIPAEEELKTVEADEAILQKQELEEQAALARAERTFNQIQIDLGRRQEALENLRRKIEDDFGLVAFEYTTEVAGPLPLPFEGMVEQLPNIKELPLDLEEQLIRQKAQLRRLGAVNPEAQQEYQSVQERYTFLKTQVDDLRKAEEDLRKVIAELDELTRSEFQKTFEAVSEQFHLIFHRLFGGGSARLTLTDPENLIETGIDIEARLPGRREQGLALLSGGERSLTAIALIFALLKVSPTPVCVMDEVDAMLDEANVGRFRELLLELSQQTQFVIITHNRNTVQTADIIYGVTMGYDSSSQVISLKLDEVSEEYLT